MSFLSALERTIKDSSLIGLVSDEIGLTGEGGLIHDSDEDCEILVDGCEDEVRFLKADLVVPLSHFSGWREYDNATMLDLEHLGGLRIRVPLSRVSRVESLDEPISSIVENATKLSDLLSVEEGEGVQFKDKKADIERAFSVIEESKNLYDAIGRSSDGMVLEEYFALLTMELFVCGICLLSRMDGSEDESDFKFDKEFLEWTYNNRDRVFAFSGLAEFWRDRISEEYADQGDVLKDAARAYASIKYGLLYGFVGNDEPDDEGYALARDKAGDGEIEDWNLWLKWFDESFAAPVNSKARKVVLCTDSPRSLDMVGKSIDGLAVVRARDVERVVEYQKRDDPLDTVKGQRDAAHRTGKDIPIAEAKIKADEYKENRRRRLLKFEEGHPRNGTLYVQHPYDTNTYFELRSFHASMLERKYNELIGILTSLGARKITCSVENSDSKNLRRKSHVAGGGSFSKVCVGNAEANASSDAESSERLSLYKKLDTHLELVPHGAPMLPTNLIYYPFEEGWRQIAQKALEDRLVKAVVDLSYRKDYAVTGKYVKELNAKIQSLIPAYDFSAGGHYESEVESELKELESIVWHYDVEFGGGAADAKQSGGEWDEPMPKQDGSAGDGRAKILARAKRLSRTEDAKRTGVLSDAQRTDLARFASKNGISEDELEDIIDEAFLES